MPKPAINLKQIPGSACATTTLKICLKCAFDFFLNELNLSPGQAYSELLNHTPEAADFSGAATARPHFFEFLKGRFCPFCGASKSWSAGFQCVRIYAHEAFEEQRAALWARLEAGGAGFALSSSEQTPMEIFSAWLDELKQKVGFDNPRWWLQTVTASIGFFKPSGDWDMVSAANLSKVQWQPKLKGFWAQDNDLLQLSAGLYGDALLVDHLIARTLGNHKRPGERRVPLPRLVKRLRRLGYWKGKNIGATDDYEAFEQAVASLVASSPQAVYYAVDRNTYLRRLKIIYKKYTD
jgi:hypothetical protein